MLLKRILLTGVCACLTLPTWANDSPMYSKAVIPSVYSSPTLLVSDLAKRTVDDSLTLFVEHIWAKSPEIKRAQSVIDTAKARLEGADRPLYNPSLVLDVERSDLNTTTIGFNQTLDWNDQQATYTLAANKRVLMAQAALREVKKKVAEEVLTALVTYQTARTMQALGVRRGELMKGFLDTVTQRQLAGDMGALEGALAQVTYGEALMRQAAIESQLAEAEAALRAVTGLDITSWPALPESLRLPPKQLDKRETEGGIKNLPELQVIAHRIEAMKAGVSVVENATNAQPTIGLRAGREGSETLLGVSFEMPLFVRNDFKSSVRVASYEVATEEQVYHEAYRRAKARLQGGLGRFQNTVTAWQFWVNSGEQAHQNQVHLLEQMWQAGELSATDYLIQAKQSLETQRAATELMGEVWKSAIVWLDASNQLSEWLGVALNAPVETQNIGEKK